MGKRQDTTNRILEVALALMGERGYHNVSVKEIAAGAGISEMTVFRHFPSKYDMLATALRSNSYREALGEFFASGLCRDLEQDLGRLMHLYFDVAEKRSEAGAIYLSALHEIPEHALDIVQDLMTFKSYLKDYFTEMEQLGRMRKGDPAAMAEVFWHICSGYTNSYLQTRRRSYPMERERYIDAALSVVLRGMAVPTGQSCF